MGLELFGQPIPCLSFGQFIAALIVLAIILAVVSSVLPKGYASVGTAASNSIAVFLVIWYFGGYIFQCDDD